MKIPQIIVIAMLAMEVGFQIAIHGKAVRKTTYSIMDFVPFIVVLTAILWVGGFFK